MPSWKKRYFWPLLILLLLTFVLTAQAGEFSGKVVGIQDGDTLTVRQDGGRITKIRLWGIDAPEKRQPFSKTAKQHLSSIAFGKKVKLLVRDTDRHHRIVAEVILPDGRNANREMVRAGYAWWYRKYAPHDWVLRDLEEQAQLKRRGLWAGPHAVPPWDYKRMRRR